MDNYLKFKVHRKSSGSSWEGHYFFNVESAAMYYDVGLSKRIFEGEVNSKENFMKIVKNLLDRSIEYMPNDAYIYKDLDYKGLNQGQIEFIKEYMERMGKKN